jgi:hypothetical protein
LLDEAKFHDSFAADLKREEGRFPAAWQVPWGVDALAGAIIESAWRSKPSWYLVATDDRMIPPPARGAMAERSGATTSEAPGSHAILVRPDVVADVIRLAAQAISA